MNAPNAGAIPLERAQPFDLPAGTWLLYLHAVSAPFFTFSVLVSRDTASLWIVGLMLVVLTLQSLRFGTGLWVDRTVGYLAVLLLLYLLSTVWIALQDSGITWGGRTPLDRALGISTRLLIAVASYAVFIHFLAEASDEVLARILRVQLVIGGLIAGFGIVQFVGFTVFHSNALTGIESTNEAYRTRTNILSLSGERVFRASSVFSEPSYFGFYLVPLVVKSIAAWVSGVVIGSRTSHILLIVVLALAVIVNFAFTALLTLALLGVWVLLVSLRRSWRSLAATIGGFAVVGLLLFLTPVGEPLMLRLEGLVGARDVSSIDRLVRAYVGLRVFLDHPLLGVGPGGFAFYYPALGFFVERNLMHTPLNLWFTVLTDVGVVGFIPLALVLGSALRRGYLSSAHNPPARVLLWGIISYLVLLTSVDLWFLDLFWFDLAFLVVVASRSPAPDL